PGIRVAVAEHRAGNRLIPERRSDPLADEDAAERHVPGGDALGEGDHVGLDAVALRGPPLSGSAEAGDDLVRDEEDVVLLAQRADGTPVALGRRDHATGADDGLAEECRDLAAALVEHL